MVAGCVFFWENNGAWAGSRGGTVGAKRGGVSQTVRSQAEPGNEAVGGYSDVRAVWTTRFPRRFCWVHGAQFPTGGIGGKQRQVCRLSAPPPIRAAYSATAAGFEVAHCDEK